MSPVDWSEHRQPNMLLVTSWRVILWVLLIEFAVNVLVLATIGNPRTSLAAALVVSLSIGLLPAGFAAYRLRQRPPPLRFGIFGIVVIATFIWAVFAFLLFIRSYQAY